MDFKPKKYRDSTELVEAEKQFAGVGRPVRIGFSDESNRYDVLPEHFCGSGVNVIVLHKVVGKPLFQGDRLSLDHSDFILIDSCEEIDVDDYDWREHLK